MNCIRLLSVASLAMVLTQPPTVSRPRALWVWDPAPFFTVPDARSEFFDFCERHRIGIVWAQVTTRLDGSRRYLDGVDNWNQFLAEAHRRQLKVHALDGDPTYAHRAQHAVPLSIVDAIVAYNTSAAASGRFDGIHFDNEPYLLIEWKIGVDANNCLPTFST
jgi:hypothetical protein